MLEKGAVTKRAKTSFIRPGQLARYVDSRKRVRVNSHGLRTKRVSAKQTVSTPQQLYGIIQSKTRSPFHVLLLSDLPEGILYVIFLKADREDWPSITCTCKYFRLVIRALRQKYDFLTPDPQTSKRLLTPHAPIRRRQKCRRRRRMKNMPQKRLLLDLND